MGCLSSIEAPLAAVITVIFLADGLYTTAYKVIESDVPMDDTALDTKDMLMTALAVMSLIGVCSSRRAFGVFTLLFMLHAFVFSLFHVFHAVTLVIRSSDEPCRFLQPPPNGTLSSEMCHVINGVSLLRAVVTMIASGLTSMAVFVRLTTVVLNITDLRSMATGRSFDNSLPRLLNRTSLESEREEIKPERKILPADLFV
ncbi:unnamed protein product [Caenorhabditis sp. 36 PRJEB53466]|nr:unnamed protein product [Caenorhabditis sp. 36 PRJEB53466]